MSQSTHLGWDSGAANRDASPHSFSGPEMGKLKWVS